MIKPPGQLPNELPDAIIARVLTGLRDTQAPAGLEDRILHTLQLRSTETRAASALTLPRIPAIRQPWTLAAAFATALLVAALVTLHPSRAPHTSAHVSRPQSVQTAPVTPAPATVAQPAVAQPPRTLWVTNPSRGFRRDERARTTLYAPQAPTDPEAAEALADTLAPSHPAPPLPLTEQEQLLVRVLQRNDPVELAQLDPLVRDAALARDQAEYQKFFTPPPPLPQNPISAEIPKQTPDQAQAQALAPATSTHGDQQ